MLPSWVRRASTATRPCPTTTPAGASLAPSLTWRADEAWSLSVSASATASRYDSLERPDGDRQVDTRWRLVPGVLWAPREAVHLWLELEGELNRSNASEEEYGAAGAGLGLDAEVLGAGRLGAWARAGVREYRDDRQARRDTPVSGGFWGAYRLTPWAEVTLAATVVDYRSTEDASDYEAWTAEGGLRFVYDHRVGGFRSGRRCPDRRPRSAESAKLKMEVSIRQSRRDPGPFSLLRPEVLSGSGAAGRDSNT